MHFDARVLGSSEADAQMVGNVVAGIRYGLRSKEQYLSSRSEAVRDRPVVLLSRDDKIQMLRCYSVWVKDNDG